MKALVVAALVLGTAAFAGDTGSVPLGGCDKREGRRPDGAPFDLFTEKDEPEDARLYYLNGIGSPGRCWEITAEAAFGFRRVFTSRIEIARAFKFEGKTLSLMFRVRAGLNADVTNGTYGIQGTLPSFGLRHQSSSGRFSLELGVRAVPGFGGPNDGRPETQALALDSILSSLIASDAGWLPFSNTGVMFYADIHSRSGLTEWGENYVTTLIGTRYGGEVSIGNQEIRTWLGPQHAMVGNAYAELFLAVPTVLGSPVELQLGFHADTSLSSIWPADQVLPLVLAGYLEWSPSTFISIRGYVGTGGSPEAIEFFRPFYGLRVRFYVP